MFKETLQQSSSAGVPFVECLEQQEVLPGIKVDQVCVVGTCIMAGKCHACLPVVHNAGMLAPADDSTHHTQGLVLMSDTAGETSTRGLDTLEADCRQYRQRGARFTKWRAALKVGDGLPSEAAVQRNADELAQYAAIAQV